MSSLSPGITTGVVPLTRLGEALRNRQALLTLLGTYVVTVLLFGLGVVSGSVFLMFLFALVAYAALVLGGAAAGLQFMDQAVGRPVTPVVAALTGSPMVVLRLIGLVLLLFVLVLAWFLVAAILLFLCKLPGIGGLLLIAVVPLLTFSGALVFAGVYVAACLAAPALFEGHSLRSALSQLWAVAVQRPVEALLNLFLLLFVVGFATMLVGGFIGWAFFTTIGMAGMLTGGPMGGLVGGLMGMGMGMGMGGFGGGVTTFGLLVGSGIVWAVVMAIFGALILYGVCLVYLKLTQGLDTAETEARLAAAMERTKEKARQAAEEARRRTQELQEAARQRAEQARQRQQQDAAATQPQDLDLDLAAQAPAHGAPAPAPATSPVQPPVASPAAAGLAGAAAAAATPAYEPTVIMSAPTAPAAPAGDAPVPGAPAVPPATAPMPPAVPPAGTPPSFEQTVLMMSSGEPPAPPPAPVQPAVFDPTVPEQPAAAPRCPACTAPVAPEDVFCGACGHKLRSR